MSQNSKASDGSSSSYNASQDLFDGMDVDPSTVSISVSITFWGKAQKYVEFCLSVLQASLLCLFKKYLGLVGLWP